MSVIYTRAAFPELGAGNRVMSHNPEREVYVGDAGFQAHVMVDYLDIITYYQNGDVANSRVHYGKIEHEGGEEVAISHQLGADFDFFIIGRFVRAKSDPAGDVVTHDGVEFKVLMIDDDLAMALGVHYSYGL